MKSSQRRYYRYLNRQKKRIKQETGFDVLLDPKVLYDSFSLCRKNVAWKESTQRYELECLANISDTINKLKDKYPISRGFIKFDINERGKIRHIRSVHISERVVQRALCDQILVPLLSKTLIYDNGASLQNKGTQFTRKRFVHHLTQFAHKYGNNGYILLIDYKKYFDNIDHQRLYEKLSHYIKDKDTMYLLHEFIDCFGDKSLGLGSQISQICSIFYVNEIDHYIKEQLRVKYYGRYMDDSYIISNSKQELKELLEKIKLYCDRDKITLSEDKTKIFKLSKPFPFLKGKYFITDTKKIVKNVNHDRVVRERAKLRKLYLIPSYSKEELYYQVKSWTHGVLKDFDNYKTCQAMWQYYYKLTNTKSIP